MEKRVHTFLKGISPNENVIVQLEFKVAKDDVAVLHVSHDTTDKPYNNHQQWTRFFLFSLFLFFFFFLPLD